MRVCRQCGSSFRGAPRSCPLDGAPLADGADPRLGRQIGGWGLLEVLAEGAFATVYRATRGVEEGALKLYVPGAPLRRARREAESFTRASHEVLVALLDAGETAAGEPYLVTELVRGASLRDALGRGPLEWRRALEIAAELAEGVDVLHRAGLVHRDLKPENVLLLSADGGDEEHVKLLDLGHALVLDEKRLTESGLVWGSAPYMSPEQAAGQPVDGRSDLYALGVMLYEMLVGRRPFEARSPVDLMQLHWTQAPVPPAQRVAIPDGASELCLWLLGKLPSARPPSGRVVVAACGALTGNVRSTAEMRPSGPSSALEV